MWFVVWGTASAVDTADTAGDEDTADTATETGDTGQTTVTPPSETGLETGLGTGDTGKSEVVGCYCSSSLVRPSPGGQPLLAVPLGFVVLAARRRSQGRAAARAAPPKPWP